MNRPIRILLVEDQPADAELITRALQRAGTELKAQRVESRDELLKALRRFGPDIVLSDFTLPGFDGLEALELVREKDPGLPFVFVSGTLGEDRAIEALKRGATDYILKNNLNRLPSAVRRALDEAANRRAMQAAEEELRSSARRLRDIVEASQDWIWELDAAGRFTFSNGTVQNILGYRPEEILGHEFDELLHPDDGWRRPSLLPDTVAGEDSIRGVRARWLHRDGTVRWLERSATVVREGPAVVGYRGNDRDVTLRLAQEARIARLNRGQLLLTSVNAAVARARERAALLQEICRLAVERGGYARALVALHDGPDPDLRPVAWHGTLEGALDTLLLPLQARPSRAEAPLAQTALLTRRAAWIAHLGPPAGKDEVTANATLRALGVQSLAVLPLHNDSETLGVLSLESREPDVFDSEELQVLGEIAAEVVQSLQTIRREETLHFLSWYDPLTQLARRELFCERLALICSEPETPGAVIVLELQDIGLVNDTFGRNVGDEMLRIAANRLRLHLGNPDRLAYLGGGTFAVALSGSDAEPGGIAQVRNRLHEIFSESMHVGEREVDMQVRTGIARHPQDADSPATLVQHAETALRRAKIMGLDDYDYTVTLNQELAERLLTGQRLHRALAQQQYLLHYQPIVDLESGRVVGTEALLRWTDPPRGMVSPDSFIPLLEESGHIVDVGQWVLDRVARDAETLQRAGLSGLRLAVNISPLQLRRPDFVERVLHAAAETENRGAVLEIEITESMLMQDLDASVDKLAELRRAGIVVSIDDFGTGYSSLALLARLPIDCLKIDRSFITPLASDGASMTVVQTVIALARSFNLRTTAEGVENPEQLALLKLLKCDHGQGYHFGRPAPLEQLLEKIAP